MYKEAKEYGYYSWRKQYGKKEEEELLVHITSRTRTIELVNRFEGIGSDTVYKRIILSNIYYFNSERCRLVIERANHREFAGETTFTQFKQGNATALSMYVESSITDEVVKKYSGKKRIFYFEKPFKLKAQNSTNRQGYGTVWDWSGGVGTVLYEGTKYGETTDYAFVGAYIGIPYDTY